MKQKQKKGENYLDRTPLRKEQIAWTEEQGQVTLEQPNVGWHNRLAQIFFKKPKISYVHLDELGSFVWPLLDGNHTVGEIGNKLEQQFGEKANPIYPRLCKYIQLLESYQFIQWEE